MTAPAVLLLPARQNSGADHRQSRWELLYGDRRVEQHDWLRPLRGDCSAQLEQAVLAAPAPVLLAAHRLGCILVAAWAAHSRNTARVRRTRPPQRRIRPGRRARGPRAAERLAERRTLR